MSVDLQFVFPNELIQVTSVRRVPGTTPVVFDVVGSDFSAVDEVLINDLTAPDFAVVSRNRLLVTAPSGFVGSLQTVSVTSRRLVMTPQSMLRFRLSKIPSKVSGILRLVQLFTKVLFTTPSSDIFNKRLGGGGLRNLGRTFSHTDSGGIISEFVVSVENTRKQIIALQSRQPSLPPDERLLAARVESARFSNTTSSLIVGVELTSQAGRSALANLQV